MTDDTNLEITGLIERIDAALATAPVKADPRERDRLERWRRELLLSLAEAIGSLLFSVRQWLDCRYFL